MTTWKDTSSNYNGKNLRAIVRVGDDQIVEANLYYSSEYVERKNEWGVTMRDATGTHRIILNCSAMRRSGNDGAFFSGGLGKSYEMAGGFKRQTLKDLQKIAEKLDDAALIAASEGDYSPTLIIGGAK
jgi:hypothetical protein